MKMRAWLLGAAVVTTVAIGGAYLNRATILSMIAQSRLPHVEPNRDVTWATGPSAAPSGDRPPNVIFILADDLGYNDITFNGGGIANGAVPTPNIDALGKEGVNFAAGYAGNATCAPSRAALMTGRYATRFGFEFTPAPVAFERMVGTASEPGAIHKPRFFKDRLKDMPEGSTAASSGAVNTLSVPTGEITIAEVLKARGYHTVHLGKWHLGGKEGSRPEQQGFDESLGFISGASMFLPEKDKTVVNAKQPWDPIDRFLWPNLPYAVQFNGSSMFAPKGYMTDYLTDQAVASIKANRNRPFFMYFAPNVDANVGRILQTLKDEGLDQNTLIVFTSDNGGAGYIGLPDVNKPYRGFKSTFFEGGIHTPFFMRWPGTIAPGTRFPYPVGHVDLFATAAGAAKASVPTDRKIDGVDLLPYVQGRAKGRPHQTMFWRSGQYKVVRDGDWKLQSNESRNKVWLYNLAVDPTERNDLSRADPARTQALLAMLKTQDAETAKPMWPSLLQGPVMIDKPSGVKQAAADEYILWDN